MQWQSYQIEYQDTGYFPQIIIDYIDQKDTLLPLISAFPSIDGISEAINKRKDSSIDRASLVSYLHDQYRHVPRSEKVHHSVSKLAEENTFTITTAHQPNLLTGPLYFIYKIVHAIRLADYCNEHIQGYHFVPVYYMGMEDADFMELNHFRVEGKTYTWQTNQTGAFGKMKVDTPLIRLLDELESQTAHMPNASSMMTQLRQCFSEGKSIAAATFEWVHLLFERFGLVVFLPDAKEVKSVLHDVMKDDLLHHTAYSMLESARPSYPYPKAWQANARPINLFYLKDHIRERIEEHNGKYQVLHTDISFTQSELMQELQNHPEHFSPNVITRPLLQEKVLPNIVYIGGAGELSYWLQLKNIFNFYEINFPVLMLRSSFVLMTDKQHEQWDKLGFKAHDIFTSPSRLTADYVRRNSNIDLSLEEEKKRLENWFNELADKATNADVTLKAHVAALHRNLQKKMDALEKKILRAEKRRFDDAARQITHLINSLFPDNTLQERKEGMLRYYAMWGAEWIDELMQHTPVPQQKMTVLTYSLSY
jgi:bacillithiol biosynthesis cysteine-adding enzyme BshC